MNNQITQFSAYFVVIVAEILSWAIFVRIILSWVAMSGRRSSGLIRLQIILSDLTEPIINLARKLPHRFGMIDLAPLIAMIALSLIASFVQQLV